MSARWYFFDGGLQLMVFNESTLDAELTRVALNSQGSVPGGWAWSVPRPGVPLKSGEIRVLPAAQFRSESGKSFPECTAPVHVMIQCGPHEQSVRLSGWPSSLPPEWQKCGDQP
ncbi:hypothetical protein [Aquabacterium humicola]|uniref:hypothetical protein n=1 Tax=Aquabacterium humicola TaxID=3237377 RepID=UPI00254336AD|nr:hypothetical protein [Rubrivivax pictus]